MNSFVRIAIILSLLLPFTLKAEHEADHRYLLFGTILSDKNAPIKGRAVSVRDGLTVLGSTTTSAEGKYQITLHLHDSDLGRELSVQSGDTKTTIRVKFKAGDPATQRQHQLDFTGGEAQDNPDPKKASGIPLAVYYFAGIALILVLANFVGKRVRKKARVKNPGYKPQLSKAHRKRNKRKKHK